MLITRKRKTVFFLISAFFLLFIDRLLKFIALNSLLNFQIIPDLFKFSLAKNQFIAFSLPLSGLLLNVLVGLIIVVLIVAAAQLLKKQEFIASYLLFFVLSGSFSNFYDRIKYGYVIDYFDLSFFTVFNLADAMITVSTLVLFLISWLEGEKKPAAEQLES